MTGDKIYKKVAAQLEAVEAMKDWVIVSGGLALHLMSMPSHVEDKHVHDHSDVDLFVTSPVFFAKVKQLGFYKVPSKYDSTKFSRYYKTVEKDGARVKVLIDAFMGMYANAYLPYLTLGGLKVLHPDKLIGLYEQKLHHPGPESTSQKYREQQILFLKDYKRKVLHV